MSYMEKEVRARITQGHDREQVAYSMGITMLRVERCIQGEHVVRVVLSTLGGDDVLYMFECLPGECLLQFHRKSDGTICFDLLPPKAQDSKEWAERIVKDLAGDKGFNAVVAPRWSNGG